MTWKSFKDILPSPGSKVVVCSMGDIEEAQVALYDGDDLLYGSTISPVRCFDWWCYAPSGEASTCEICAHCFEWNDNHDMEKCDNCHELICNRCANFGLVDFVCTEEK